MVATTTEAKIFTGSVSLLRHRPGAMRERAVQQRRAFTTAADDSNPFSGVGVIPLLGQPVDDLTYWCIYQQLVKTEEEIERQKKERECNAAEETERLKQIDEDAYRDMAETSLCEKEIRMTESPM
ncbi:hypothetical protein TWF696_001822 [Orbilia brochopaga]|uniref:Uncharacterized protein n=1 Tax=Orbilia brochopaga TaxID=3140254 RepID=A0AAV9U9F0_9PEZI